MYDKKLIGDIGSSWTIYFGTVWFGLRASMTSLPLILLNFFLFCNKTRCPSTYIDVVRRCN